MNTPYGSAGSDGERFTGQAFNDDRERLERDIDSQRNHISELMHALESKLSPGEIFDRLFSSSSGGGEFVRNLGNTVKANPLPTLLTAAGLIWLYKAKDEPAAGVMVTDATVSVFVAEGEGLEAGHSTSGTGGMRDRVSGSAHGAKEKVTERAHRAKEKVSQGAHRANEGLHRMLEDNPMAVGAMAIAAGALLGVLLPTTSKENELLGEASDRVTQRAKEAVDEVSRAGREVTQPQSAKPDNRMGVAGASTGNPGVAGDTQGRGENLGYGGNDNRGGFAGGPGAPPLP